MGLSEKIAERVGVNIAKYGSLRVLTCHDAAVFLDGCEAAGVRVLGIEGFLIREDSVVPDMNVIADFSDISSASESILEARRFIKDVLRHGLMLEFSLSQTG